MYREVVVRTNGTPEYRMYIHLHLDIDRTLIRYDFSFDKYRRKYDMPNNYYLVALERSLHAR